MNYSYQLIRQLGKLGIGFQLLLTGLGLQAAEPKEIPDTIATKRLDEVTVTTQSARQRVASARLGSESLEMSRLALTPQLFGENDLIKSITLLPGVRNEADGAGGFEVRGGNATQNLVMMDGMTLYNPAHMMGIFSTFNDDAISRAVLHKGPVPAYFGGASSSVLETSMKPGDMTDHHFSGTVGILSAKVAAEGPIAGDRFSFAVSARRSYVDMFLKIIPQYKSTVMNFADANAKLRYKIGQGSMLDVSLFASRDNLAIADLMEMRWGNVAGSINLDSRRGDNLRFVTTLSATDYTTLMAMNMMDSNKRMRQYIRSASLNERAILNASENHTLEAGARSEILRVKSGDMMMSDYRLREIRSGWQNALWADYAGTLSERWILTAGVRISVFTALTGHNFRILDAPNEEIPPSSTKIYIHAEPRVSMKFNLSENHNVKAGVSGATQNLHGVRSGSTTFPFDRYALSSDVVRPEVSTQFSAAYAGMTSDGGWDWSGEIYYRNMKNVYDYRDGFSMFSRVNIESILLGGKGRSRGLELMLRKNTGRLSGWISYTLSKTETRIPGINDGRWYDASNDRRNDIAIVGIFAPNDRWNFSASWTYASGRPLTAPDAKYEIAGTTCYYYSSRNSYKTPASHRLDLSATYRKTGRRYTTEWAFGVYNAYCYYSPYVIYFEDDPSKPSGTRAVQRSLFGLVPSVSYTVKF